MTKLTENKINFKPTVNKKQNQSMKLNIEVKYKLKEQNLF